MPDIVDISSPETLEQPKQQPKSETAVPEQPRQKRTLRLSEITEMATRLGRVLAEESHYLSTMNFSAIDKLQEEKMKLVTALDIQKKILKIDPSIKASYSEEEVKEFENVSVIFDQILVENYRQLTRVKLVNKKIVDIIAKAAADESKSPTSYGKNGCVAAKPLSDLPLALNQNV